MDYSIERIVHKNPFVVRCHTSLQRRTEQKRRLGVLYGNGAFYSLTARRQGSYVTIPVQPPKSPSYYVRLDNLVWCGGGRGEKVLPGLLTHTLTLTHTLSLTHTHTRTHPHTHTHTHTHHSFIQGRRHDLIRTSIHDEYDLMLS